MPVVCTQRQRDRETETRGGGGRGGGGRLTEREREREREIWCWRERLTDRDWKRELVLVLCTDTDTHGEISCFRKRERESWCWFMHTQWERDWDSDLMFERETQTGRERERAHAVEKVSGKSVNNSKCFWFFEQVKTLFTFKTWSVMTHRYASPNKSWHVYWETVKLKEKKKNVQVKKHQVWKWGFSIHNYHNQTQAPFVSAISLVQLTSTYKSLFHWSNALKTGTSDSWKKDKSIYMELHIHGFASLHWMTSIKLSYNPALHQKCNSAHQSRFFFFVPPTQTPSPTIFSAERRQIPHECPQQQQKNILWSCHFFFFITTKRADSDGEQW